MDQKHHFVPEFLQKPWVGDDGSLETFRLDLPHVPMRRWGPGAVGEEENLFALTESVGGVDRQFIENEIFKPADNFGALVHQRLLAGQTELTEDERSQWATLILSLRLRQPEVIGRLKNEAPGELKKHLAAPPSLEEFVDPVVVKNFGLLKVLPNAMANPVRPEQIASMRWHVWDFSSTGVELLLSDRPSTIIPHIDNPMCIVALPISPTKAFIATHSEAGERKLRSVLPGTVAEILNQQAVINARPRVYARDQRLRQFILDHMKLRSQS